MYQYELPFERWALIEEYPDYEVSDHGRVRRCRPDRRGLGCGRVLRPALQNKYGHTFVNLTQNGRQRTRRVHRLVALAFLGPCPPGHEVDHKDFDPTNNHWSNLQYLTHADNNRRSFRAGRIVLTHHRGEQANTAKLTDAAVCEIRRRYREGGVYQRQLALDFGITQAHVSSIIRKASWAHVA